MLSRKTLSVLLLGALTWLLLLSSPANAAPTGTLDSDLTLRAPGRRTKPNLPRTKQELRDKYFKKAPPKDKSCFFTGMNAQGVKANPEQNTYWAKELCNAAKLTTLDVLWTKKNIVKPSSWKAGFTHNDYENFIVWMSEIFAEETTGIAYVFIADSLEPKTTSIFFNNEFGAMKAGGKVTEIKRLDFSNERITDPTKGKVWWKKGDEDPESWP